MGGVLAFTHLLHDHHICDEVPASRMVRSAVVDHCDDVHDAVNYRHEILEDIALVERVNDGILEQRIMDLFTEDVCVAKYEVRLASLFQRGVLGR